MSNDTTPPVAKTELSAEDIDRIATHAAERVSAGLVRTLRQAHHSGLHLVNELLAAAMYASVIVGVVVTVIRERRGATDAAA